MLIVVGIIAFNSTNAVHDYPKLKIISLITCVAAGLRLLKLLLTLMLTALWKPVLFCIDRCANPKPKVADKKLLKLLTKMTYEDYLKKCGRGGEQCGVPDLESKPEI